MLQPKILILLITEIALLRDCRGCCSLYVVYALLEIDEEARIRLPLGGMPKHCWHQGSVPYWNSSGSCCFYWQERYLSIVEIRVEARGPVSPRYPYFHIYRYFQQPQNDMHTSYSPRTLYIRLADIKNALPYQRGLYKLLSSCSITSDLTFSVGTPARLILESAIITKRVIVRV